MPQLKVPDEDLRKVVMALRHPSVEVRAAACFRLEAIADPRTVGGAHRRAAQSN